MEERTSIDRIEEPQANTLNSEEDFDLEKWVDYTGLKIKEYKPEELEAFKRPFHIGWKRELSIRAQLHSSGKRIVDISYISPCNQVRLRSYVELGVYLRNAQSCGLEPENFTFAKQPVFKYPEEVIKQLLKTVKHERRTQQQNGVMPQLTPIGNEQHNRNGSESNSLNNSFNNSSLNSVAEGRTKRKRTAPTRFDDEEYFEVKKKLLKSQSTTQTVASSSKLSSQSSTPSRLNVQPFSPKSKSQQSVDDVSNNFESVEKEYQFNVLKKDENSQDQIIVQQINQPTVADTSAQQIANSSINNTTTQSINKPSKPKSSKRKSAKQANNTNDLSILDNSLLVESLLQNGNFECEDNDLSECDLMIDTMMPNINDDQQIPIPPCSLICAGEGDLPSLRCSRCLCFFHPQCVSTGIFLKDAKRFVCPNCVLPDDINNAIKDPTQLFEESNDLMFEDESFNETQSFIANDTILIKTKPINSATSQVKSASKSQNLGKQINSHSKTNGMDAILAKQLQLPQSNQQNQMNQNRYLANRKRISTKMNINQQAQHQRITQNPFNTHLLKRLNELASIQENIVNHKSNITQLSNGTFANSSIASRRTHLDSMNKSLESSQQLIESFKKLSSFYSQTSLNLCNGSINLNNIRSKNKNSNNTRFEQQYQQPTVQRNLPTGSLLQQRLTHHQQQRTHHPDPRETKYIDYLNKHQNGLKIMMDQYQAFDKIFDYLTVRDLIKCKQVNKIFNRLASEKHHWKRLTLKGLIIKDWNILASKIVDSHQAEELNLEGIRLRPKTDQQPNPEDDLWTNFKSCYKHFNSIKKINFGRISTQHLNYLLSNDDPNESNPLYDLEELSVRILYDSSVQSGFFSLKLLGDKISKCKNLKCLRIESKQGISNDESTLTLLNSLSDILPKLRSLYLPSLRGFAIDDFEFLIKLTQLECLEIGSCESWTLGDQSANQEPANDSEANSNLENNENINRDDEFMNENSNQENEFGNFDGQRKSLIKKHQGAFKYLSQLRNLKKLQLTDVIIDEMSNQLPLVVERMSDLESLGLGYVTVSPDATQTLNILCSTLKTKLPNLRKFSISTDDPHTNKAAFDLLLKRLDNLEELRWKVSSQVEDDGHCLVPFVKDRGLDSDMENDDNLDLTTELSDCIEMVEACYLNEILQKNLNKTKVYILPQ